MRHQTVIQMSIQRLSCTSCGAEANASCNCGKPYVPAKQRAKEAIAANPHKSDGAIADEIGVSDSTVLRARREAGSSDEEPERLGRDGKVYSLPVARKEPDADKIERENQRNILLMNAAASVEAAVYHGPVDENIIDACRRTAEAWSNLAESLEGIIR